MKLEELNIACFFDFGTVMFLLALNEVLTTIVK